MADFRVPATYANPQYQYQQPQSDVQWYSAGASGQQYLQQPYAYDASAASTSAGNYGSFEDEPPLLEELGIDIPAILGRIKSVVTFRLSGRDLDNFDMGGPLIFMTILGVLHLLVGKLHFGYILGWTVVGSVLIWFVLQSIVGSDHPEAKSLDLYTCCCLLGYSLLPIIGHAVVALLLPRQSLPSLIGAGVAVLWSAQVAATMFLNRTAALMGQRLLVTYPCILMFSAYALLTLY